MTAKRRHQAIPLRHGLTAHVLTYADLGRPTPPQTPERYSDPDTDHLFDDDTEEPW